MTEENPTPPPAPEATTTSPAPQTLDYSTFKSGEYAGPAPTKDEINLGILIFVLGLVSHFLGPLLIWLLKKNESPFVDYHGKEVLNFQITVFLAMVVSVISMFLLIGIVLVPAVSIAYVVFMIIGAVTVSKGTAYHFPFAIRLLK